MARAEEFIREQLPDGSAQRKLSSLLHLRKNAEQQRRNEDLRTRLQKQCCDLQSLGKRCEELERKNADLSKICEEFQKRCGDLEKMSQTLQVAFGTSFSWDLFGCDLSNFSQGQEKKSDKFQICSGITAWIALLPKGHSQSPPGKAAVYLFLDKVAKVKFRFRAGQVDRTLERDFSTSLRADGTPQSWGWADFIDSSALQGASITLDVLSVQPANSSLKFLAPGAKV